MTAASDAAHAYARRGWPVIPIAPQGKTPALGVGLNHATRDHNTIDVWYLRQPRAGVGIVCNEASGVLVVDIDPRSGGTDSMRDLVRNIGSLWLTTLTAATGGGGHHLVYQHPGGSIRNGAHVLGPGVDVKALGYIVAAPSVHASGQVYRWLPGSPRNPQPLPAALRRLLLAPRQQAEHRSVQPVNLSGQATRYGAAALRGLVADVSAAKIGSRNHELNRAAFRGYRLASGGEIPLSDVTESLVAAALAVGLPEAEARATLASARRQGLQQPLTAPPRVAA